MNFPSFVIAGQPNEGKTTVVATLTEDEKARIGPIPGTTRELKKYTVEIDGEPKLILYDTPGFENPGELLEWFQIHASRHENPAEAFLAISNHGKNYPFDCEILKPIAAGAAVIHVVNPGREPRQEDGFEAEIFRRCKVPRIGVMNRRSGGTDHRKEWIGLMKSEMNTWREFNACEAVFADRRELLEAFTIAVPEWSQQMKEVVRSLAEQWNTRLFETASLIVDTLRNSVKIQVFEPYDGVQDQEAAKSRADKMVRDKLGELEKDFRHKTRGVFRHGTDHWTAGKLLELDLFDEKVWQVFGFSKKALVIGGALAGAGIGTLIDIATGGGTIGIGALVGAVVGGVGTYFSADKAVEMTLPGLRLGPLKIPGRKIGGVSLKAGIERRSKLPGILLDRMSCYAVASARWSHGRRPETPGSSPTDDVWRITHALEKSQGPKTVSRLQSLIELWHRSRDKSLGSKEEAVVLDTEAWLQKQLIQLLERATCEKKK